MYITCANEYAKEEYIPENISLYKTERSLATIAMTDEQLFVPMTCNTINTDDSMLNRSC